MEGCLWSVPRSGRRLGGGGETNQELWEERQKFVDPESSQVLLEAAQPGGCEEGFTTTTTAGGVASGTTGNQEVLRLGDLNRGVQPERDQAVDLIPGEGKHTKRQSTINNCSRHGKSSICTRGGVAGDAFYISHLKCITNNTHVH